MEIQTVEREIEILRETTTETERIKKTCGEIPCGFYGAEYTEDLSVSKKKLSTVIILCLIFMSIEIVGGIKSHSLAVLTDAAHQLSDVVCFDISLFSLYASRWEATPRRSFGYFRIEILANLASILLTWALNVWIVSEAIIRLFHKNREIKGSLMF
ncbi:unnamed protein product [Arabidopsis lyrata]|nr:unnamed protein product [Arabidopsis lyrata]